MTVTETRRKIGTATGEAAEWLHFPISLWVVHTSLGTWGAAAFVASSVAGRLIAGRGPRALGLAAPAGLLLLLLGYPGISLLGTMAAGFFLGAGSGAAGRSTAFLAGIRWEPRWAAVVGGLLTLVAARFLGPALILQASATAMVIAWVAGEEATEIRELPRPLYWGATAAAFCAGLRVLEPQIAGSAAAAALFSFVWVLGLKLGSGRSLDADARAVVAAVFGCSAATAVLGIAHAWSAVFLWLGLAAAVGFVCGVGPRPGAAGRGSLASAAVAGSVWAAASGVEAGFLGSSAVALAGGFVAWRKARAEVVVEEQFRVRAAAGVTVRPSPPPAVPPEPPERRDPLTEAASILLEATRQATHIRREALEALREATAGPGPKSRAIAVIDETLDAARRAQLDIRSIRW